MERVMAELAGYFAEKKDIEIHLILYGFSLVSFYPVPESTIVHRPSFTFNKHWRVISTVKTLFYLRTTIRDIRPDAILSFGEYWNSFILIALIGLRFPVFISDRCQPDKSLGILHDWLRKMLYPGAAGIIAQTQKAGAIYRSQYKNKNVRVIGNPIRTIESGTAIVKENIVLMVGRLIRSKNQDKLIELFIQISKPDWKLVIVGYDHLGQNISDKLKKIIEDNHAGDSVFLVGKQTDVEAHYLKSRIFAFTSESEGFPNVIGEAMSAGLPVIAFDCIAGPSEMIKDNLNGFLIQLFDYEMFKEKLEILMDNEELRISFGDNAREDIRQFSIESIGEQYYQLLVN